VPLIPDAERAAREWHERHGLIPINHMVCVGPSIAQRPELTADLLAALHRGYDAAAASASPPGPAITLDRERIETTLRFALGLARQQRLVTSDLDVSALFAPARQG
jgi:4,5-dihydroxyphthalate decarboxylase